MPAAGRPQGGLPAGLRLDPPGRPRGIRLACPRSSSCPSAARRAAVEMLVLPSIAGSSFKPAGEPGAAPAVSDRVATDRPKAVDRLPPALGPADLFCAPVGLAADQRADLQLHAGPHGGAQRNLADIGAL